MPPNTKADFFNYSFESMDKRLRRSAEEVKKNLDETEEIFYDC